MNKQSPITFHWTNSDNTGFSCLQKNHVRYKKDGEIDIISHKNILVINDVKFFSFHITDWYESDIRLIKDKKYNRCRLQYCRKPNQILVFVSIKYILLDFIIKTNKMCFVNFKNDFANKIVSFGINPVYLKNYV